MSPQEVRAQLLLVAAQLDAALEAQVQRFEQERHQPWGVQDPYLATDANGRPLLLDALASLGQVWAALAALDSRP